MTTELSKTTPPKKSPPLKLSDLILTFLTPTLVGKTLLIYFGLNYTDHPGEGYGYGLIIAILFTATMMGRFLWKYRNYEE